MLPMIAIPTTAGTGSECQSFALIADEQTHQKMACGDAKAAPRVAILDPLLTLTQPRAVTACTGMDAVTHAVETAVSRKRNAVSWIFSREAFRLTRESFPAVLANPDDVAARGGMLFGAALAGFAIENSMLGAAHSAANPLTARHGIVHGQAVGLMLPGVVRRNARHPQTRRIYAELAVYAGLAEAGGGEKEALTALVDCLEDLLSRAGIGSMLPAEAAEQADPPRLAVEAAGQWTAQFNPVPMKAEDFQELYEWVLPDPARSRQAKGRVA
jgi:alcohol dehydrogenase